MNRHAMLVIALLPLAACASTTAPAPTVPGPVATAYQDMSCAELEAALRERNSDAAWARRQQQQTFGGDTTSNATVSFPMGGGGPSAGAPSNRSSSSQDRAGLRNALAAKGCS